MPDMFNAPINVSEAPIAPKAHTAQTSSSPSQDSSEKSFKSVLEKQLPKEQQSTTDTSRQTKSQSSQAAEAASENNTLASTDDQPVSESSQEEIAETESNVTDDLALALSASEETAQGNSVAPLIINLTGNQKESKKNFFAQLTSSLKTTDSAVQTTASSKNIAKSVSEQQSSLTTSAAQQAVINNLTARSDSPSTLTPQQEALLLRIENLIENGDIGTVTIQKAALSDESSSLRQQLALLSSVQVQEADESQSQLGRIVASGSDFTELEDGVFGQTLRSRHQQMTGLRQDATHQFYGAKTQPDNSSNDSATAGGNQQGGEMAQQGSGFSQAASIGSQSEAGSTFSLSANGTTDTSLSQTTDTTKTTVLPTGTIVHDHEVIQQMVERFQMSRRLMDTKIQMKLHPAELGEMEIDLTVKEGSIRANVVAQSQHVQEILERNLNRLKTVLEQHGFNIEEISITTESEMVGEFDLFDQQQPSSEQRSYATHTQTMEPLTPFIIEELENDYLGSATGVNVKA